jgi:hypothetical protein
VPGHLWCASWWPRASTLAAKLHDNGYEDIIEILAWTTRT